ncbi:hypothetical protein [Gallaecimonas sp. GXIMD4217]|uniref:hypothetical protein n=1 Tax=Gallaecimonas sp. GXIMD4217 TaxID=3131927 RepID=UPI00311AEDD2
MTATPSHSTLLRQSRHWLSQEQQRALLPIIDCCFGGIAPEDYLHKYFLSEGPFERRLKLFYDGRQLVGYCLLTFSRACTRGRPLVLIGASAAFLPAYRHGNQTLAFSIAEALAYKLRHPLTRVYFADTMISPAMYRVMAKALGLIFPHPEHELDAGGRALLKSLQCGVMDREPHWHPHLCRVGRQAQYDETELARFRQSDKAEIRYYLDINPDFHQGYGVLALVPVTFANLLKTLWKRLGARP